MNINIINLFMALIILVITAVYDIRKKAVPVYILCVLSICTASVILFISKEYPAAVGGIIPGILIYLFGKFTDTVGEADSAVIVMTGALIGSGMICAVVLLALFITAVPALFIIVLKGGKQREIPFLPVLFASYISVFFFCL